MIFYLKALNETIEEDVTNGKAVDIPRYGRRIFDKSRNRTLYGITGDKIRLFKLTISIVKIKIFPSRAYPRAPNRVY